MARATTIIEHIFIVHVQAGGPQREDLEARLKAMEALRRTCGRGLQYVLDLGETSQRPMGAERKLVDEIALRTAPLLQNCHAVVRGTGLKRAMLRSVVSLLGGIDWWKRGIVLTVHQTVEEALRQIAGEDHMNLDEVLKAAREAGVIPG